VRNQVVDRLFSQEEFIAILYANITISKLIGNGDELKDEFTSNRDI
jgi:hypothetical protein